MGVLRLCLAVAVLLFHSHSIGDGIKPISGQTAVFVFFVISGFYMELVLSSKYTKERLGQSYVLKFYASRYLRLFPIYALVVLSAIALSFFFADVHIPKELTHPSNFSHLNSLLHYLVAVVANATMLFANLPSVKELIIPPLWSVGIELSFYLVAPFLLRLKWQWLLLASVFGLVLQYVSFGQHSPIFFGIHFFIYGALLYRYRNSLTNFHELLNIRGLKWLLYLLVFVLIFYSIPSDIWIGRSDIHSHNTLDKLFYPILLGLLVPWLHILTEKSKVDFYLGQLSYPFYLVHQPILDIANGYPKFNHLITLIFLSLIDKCCSSSI